jgi:hypothetical protein
MEVRAQDIRSGNFRNQATVRQTQNVIRPTARAPEPQPLAAGERGRLGENPPRAARQGGREPTTGQGPVGGNQQQQRQQQQGQKQQPDQQQQPGMQGRSDQQQQGAPGRGPQQKRQPPATEGRGPQQKEQKQQPQQKEQPSMEGRGPQQKQQPPATEGRGGGQRKQERRGRRVAPADSRNSSRKGNPADRMEGAASAAPFLSAVGAL